MAAPYNAADLKQHFSELFLKTYELQETWVTAFPGY